MSIPEEYSEKHVQFLGDTQISKILEDLLMGLKDYSLIDLGCGDGAFLHGLYRQGLLKHCRRAVGVDISDIRIKRFKENCPFAEGIVGDVCDLKAIIPDNAFDVAISNQVIKHVSDDSKMIREVYRILKPHGYLYISTVIKKWYGVWVYYNGGFKLDPTHVREYRSESEFLELLKRNNFKILRWETHRVSFPLIDLVVRALIKGGVAAPTSDFYLKHPNLHKLRFLRIPVIGYRTIEVIGCKL